MTNRLKSVLILVLAMAFCLNLAACGGSGDVAGDDWRVSGVVVGSGTITHDGDSVDVLVTVSESSAAFYWDKAEQLLFDSVSFPMNIPDAKQAFNIISFDDIDGDGESDVLVRFIHENGDTTELIWIWDPVERYVFREDLSTITLKEKEPDESIIDDTDQMENLEAYIGLWEYQDKALWLRIYDDATWEFLNDQEELLDYGTLWVDENGVTLHFDSSGDVLQLYQTVSGDLIDTANGSTLLPVETIQSQEPYFAQNGLEINASLDAGTFLLKDGVCSYSGLGDGYNTNDCYWEVVKKYDKTHDGIREIQFDAISYIPEASIPYFDQQYITNTNSELYDSYTGMWLTAATAYGNSQRGENYYIHTVNWQGNSYLIEFSYSTDWQDNVGDWAKIFTKSYVVYIPEEYDGLVFAAESQPADYKSTAKRMQLDSISPDESIMDIETLEPYNNLYFSLCY